MTEQAAALLSWLMSGLTLLLLAGAGMLSFALAIILLAGACARLHDELHEGDL